MKNIFSFLCLTMCLYVFAGSNKIKDERLVFQSKQDISLKDYGAVGDGKNDDSQAFQKALEAVSKSKSKILIIPANNNFNLSGNSIDFNQYESGIILKFEGGFFSHGKFSGNYTKISGSRLKILDLTMQLTGTFIPMDDFAYPEWYGIYPNDKQYDLADALRMLNSVFFDISLGIGDYYTKKGEISVKGLTGVSMEKTKVYYETEKSNTFLLSLGKIGGKLSDRTYDYNYIKNMTLLISGKTGVRQKGNRGIIVGAVHKPLLENVKIFQYSDYQQLGKKDLDQFVSGSDKISDVNVGIEFRGDSELTTINNLYTLSDVGILFSEFTDFVTVRDYTHNSGLFGLATVYYRSTALPSQNILFTGAQSWNQGLYGFYAEKSNTTASFANVKLENVRIEQLTSNIRLNNKLEGANIWLSGNEIISNLQLHNIMLAGTANGIHIGPTAYGRLSLRDIITWSDKNIVKDFALDVNFSPNSSLIVFLNNVSLGPDAKSNFEKGNLMSSYFKKEDTYEGQNLYMNDVIIAENSLLQKNGLNGSGEEYVQKIKLKSNNTNFVALNNSSVKLIQKNKQTVKYEIELFGEDLYEKFSFIIFANGKTQLISKDPNSLFSLGTVPATLGKINLLQDKDSGFIFIANKLNVDCWLNITTDVIN